MKRRTLLSAATAMPWLGTIPFTAARAQTPGTIRLGVLNDMSGPYRDISGPTSVACVQQAVKDSGLESRGIKVEMLSADHQNRADVASGITRQWLDRDGVDAIVDVPNSGAALAVNSIIREKNKVHLNAGAATSDLTGAQCSPNTVHWTYDTYMLAKSTGSAVVKLGGMSWFFLAVDYAFGQAMQRDTTKVVNEMGGKVVGSAKYPLNTTDLSSLLLQAQASQAKVIAFANAGTDTINSVKQAVEFGLPRSGVRLVTLLMYVNDVHALGLNTAQKLICTETFYWDLNDRTRAFTERVRPLVAGNLPCMTHAGCYAASLHYLKAVADLGVAAAKASGVETVDRMKAMPTDDDCFGPGVIRIDGRKIHPAYLFEVKSPEESKHPWDYYKLVGTTPGEEAFRPLADGGCALVKA
ncbi:MAG: ABC transporter substrate-binding protein [Acetobacteraceae bacterium]